jgi:ABC-type transporter Mla MlaB component
MPKKKKIPEDNSATEINAEISTEINSEMDNNNDAQHASSDDTIPSANVNDDGYSYTMKNEMSLDEIQNFVDDIANQLNNHNLIYINLQEAERISTATVQAIISLNRHAGDNDKKIKWQNPSTGFSDAFNNLGFYSEMMKLEFA